ncbi:DUF6302 family protein [Streptomyces griseoluteus]|uniref:DUF6302 family protein n=1 Tax=Streptomyces griseoluteus TaxID=29306 RepID=UPI0036B223C0
MTEPHPPEPRCPTLAEDLSDRAQPPKEHWRTLGVDRLSMSPDALGALAHPQHNNAAGLKRLVKRLGLRPGCSTVGTGVCQAAVDIAVRSDHNQVYQRTMLGLQEAVHADDATGARRAAVWAPSLTVCSFQLAGPAPDAAPLIMDLHHLNYCTAQTRLVEAECLTKWNGKWVKDGDRYIHSPALLCRPSPEECAEDHAWFRERLSDPGLLDSAGDVKVDGAAILAVPAGGSRGGGHVPVGNATDPVRVWAALRRRPGAPRLRIRLSVHSDTCHTVNSGPRRAGNDAGRGRRFGCVQPVVGAFLRRVSILQQKAGSETSKPVQSRERTWQQDPLLSTLRDIGGCLAVILMGVLITLLVSAVRGNWPSF